MMAKINQKINLVKNFPTIINESYSLNFASVSFLQINNKPLSKKNFSVNITNSILTNFKDVKKEVPNTRKLIDALSIHILSNFMVNHQTVHLFI